MKRPTSYRLLKSGIILADDVCYGWCPVKMSSRTLRSSSSSNAISTKTQPKTEEAPLIPVTKGPVIRMTSNMADKAQNDHSMWPSTSKFESIWGNVLGERVNKSTIAAIREGMKIENKVTCGCRPGQDCSTNPACRCFQTASRLREHFGSDILTRGKPVKTVDTMYWDRPMFACSGSCGCKGQCNLNALQDICEDPAKKFKITRTDGKGFCVYSARVIKKGSPVLEFSGEITDYLAIKSNADIEQYSIMLYNNETKLCDFFSKEENLSSKYKKILWSAYRSKAWINPLNRGNCARFFSHGCKANMELGRVFQGGFSPADMKIVLFAKEIIKPGTELTFNYGPSYKEIFLGNKCLCEACKKEAVKKLENAVKRILKNSRDPSEPPSKKKSVKKLDGKENVR